MVVYMLQILNLMYSEDHNKTVELIGDRELKEVGDTKYIITEN